jgi:hypothetical protein
MNTQRHTAQLNRALFMQRPLDSSALGSLATLLHRFTDVGTFELIVRREGQTVRRETVQVIGRVGEPAPGVAAPYQINRDLATLPTRTTGACDEPAPCTLNAGGVMGFYVSEGTARYTVGVSYLGANKTVVLDSAENLPVGDFFAVTLLRPGVYRVTNRLGDAHMRVRVDLPKRTPRRGEGGEASDPRDRYSPRQITLAQALSGGFDPPEAALFSGQSLLFQCQTASSILIELAEPAPEADRPTGDRPRRRFERSRNLLSEDPQKPAS